MVRDCLVDDETLWGAFSGIVVDLYSTTKIVDALNDVSLFVHTCNCCFGKFFVSEMTD